MEKKKVLLAVAALAVGVAVIGSGVLAKLAGIYKSQVGVKEGTQPNTGKEVNEYLKAAGTTPGLAWCSAFLKWCFDKAGVKTTINAWSPTAYNPKNVVYANGKILKPIQPGDVFTLHNGTRIYHAGFVDSIKGNVLTTVEGNTNTSGSANGDGVYKRTRTLNTIHNISRWV